MMSVFFYTKQIVQSICTGGPAFLKHFYCQGTQRSNWRNPTTGAIYIDYKEEGLKQFRSRKFRKRGFTTSIVSWRTREFFLAVPPSADLARINYIVPSLNSSVELARKMADAMHAPFVFPPIRDYDTFDGSHLWPRNRRSVGQQNSSSSRTR